MFCRYAKGFRGTHRAEAHPVSPHGNWSFWSGPEGTTPSPGVTGPALYLGIELSGPLAHTIAESPEG